MGKLHEVLAVEPNLEQVARNITEEAKHTFGHRPRFTGSLKRLEMFDEDRRGEETEETVEVATTVDEKLAYAREPIARWWDAVFQKELANQEAKADVVVDGEVLIKDAPVPFLLNLEKRLNELRDMFMTIPTLKPGVAWIRDEGQRDGVLVSQQATIRFKTEKTLDIIIATEATNQHKAQYEKVSKDKPVGKYVETEYTGTISPARKSDMLERIDKLIVAVKQARMQGNSQEVPNRTCASGLFDYILK